MSRIRADGKNGASPLSGLPQVLSTARAGVFMTNSIYYHNIVGFA